MSVTISDVAAEAGVSKSTVSKVLNHWSTISPATVQRVNDAIERLHYIPNSRAVSFARQTTDNIVYLANLEKNISYRNPHMFDIMCGIQHELTAQGYTVTLVDTSEEAYPGERSMQEITRRSADGLIIHGSAITRELADRLVRENVPHIIIGHPEYDARLCWIDTNHSLAGEVAAEHMAACGYYHVLYVAASKNGKISVERMKGFFKGMLNHGHHLPKDYVCYTDGTREMAYQNVKEMLSEWNQHSSTGHDIFPQAIVCENTLLSLGVVKALRELGLSIPADIGLVTFDRYPYADIIDPTPTVVDINVYDMGVQAGNMMIRKLANPGLLVQSYTTLPTLIQGQSTCLISH